ncbi:MAG: hypothetical protein LQ350_008551 [Teloschistes chrysophthalmus]|nr:MAG: hypothetical protein LQ350_008551 [Niorma chrysophthalma]
MWHKRSLFSCIGVITTLLASIHAAAVPDPLSPPSSNRLAIPSPLHSQLSTNLTFLGTMCYHLLPDTVTLEACSPLFDTIFGDPRVMMPREQYNGWRFMLPQKKCTLMIASPNIREDKRVMISLAEVVSHAIEVLRFCDGTASGTGTGGSYTFQGRWQVVVTKDPVILPRTGVMKDQQ